MADRDAPDAPRQCAESVTGEHRLGACDIRFTQLQHCAELLAEERRDGLSDAAEIDVDRGPPRKSHFNQRDREAAVRAIVIREAGVPHRATRGSP
jgi:hypothetical protein